MVRTLGRAEESRAHLLPNSRLLVLGVFSLDHFHSPDRTEERCHQDQRLRIERWAEELGLSLDAISSATNPI